MAGLFKAVGGLVVALAIVLAVSMLFIGASAALSRGWSRRSYMHCVAP
ncbi:hypothetical protein GA0061102_106119 [Rhizobium miluonense]|uniref:Uncharacterized protein n=1 Tax=Rhizobium miluonense TaxID=411945 RepID=A0A1C3X6I1_9HYPH|nr:hypothetical protein GA0061102_106119 [Rhizobium miluonense]